MGSKVLLAFGVATLSIGLLLNIVGMATPEWSVLNTDEKLYRNYDEVALGPWKWCDLNDDCDDMDLDTLDNLIDFLKNVKSHIKLKGVKVDVDIIDSDDVRAVQACTVLGALLTAASLVVAVLMAFTKKDKLRFLTGGLGVLAAVSIIIGVVYWYTSIQENLDDLARVAKPNYDEWIDAMDIVFPVKDAAKTKVVVVHQFPKDVSFDLGYSFAISCVSAVFVLVGSVCTGMYDD